MTKPMRLESLSKPYRMQPLGDKTGERVTQHRGVYCPWSGRPDLGRMCREQWTKNGPTKQRDLPLLFAWCIPKRGGRVVTSPDFSPIKRVKTSTWSRSVNSEDFLIAEADHVQSNRRLVEILLEVRRPHPSANLASSSSANLRRSRM